MSLSPSAVIVIAICGAAVAVTILFAFARYWGGPDLLETKILNRSESQEMYMRQVRQRSREHAYTEAASAAASAAGLGTKVGPSARTSQVLSNIGGVGGVGGGAGGAGPGGGQTTPGTPATAGGYWPRQQQQQQQYGYPSPGGSSPGYVNYSSYDETAGGQYYEHASPYGNGNEYYEYEQQYPQKHAHQNTTAAVQPLRVNGESSGRPVDEHALPPV